MSDFKIRTGKFKDITELQQLFTNTIKAICQIDYNKEQIEAWVSGSENIERWKEMVKTQYVLVVEQKNKIIGFVTLKDRGYIDLLYVHKDFQRQGIAYGLYTEIENKARQQNQKELSAEVSKTAKPFFEYVGFKVIEQQTVVRRNIEFTNFKMKKSLI